jgi:hypothetical protein
VEAKQSNDFSGSGNDVTLDAAGSALTTQLTSTNCASSIMLAPGGQPADAIVGQPISSTAYQPEPGGGPVQVDVVNSNGQTVTSYNGPVSVALIQTGNGSTNPTPSTLGGTTTVNAVSGVASFGDLTVSAPGNGYALGFTGPSGSSATSNSFDVHQNGTVCQAGATCTTDQQSSDYSAGTAGAIDAAITSPGGTNGTYLGVNQGFAILSESIDFGTWSSSTRSSECPNETPGAHFVYGSFTDGSGAVVARAFNVSLTTIANLGANLSALIPAQEICFASAKPFQTVSPNRTLVAAQAVTLPDGSPGYAGTLPTCTGATGFNNLFDPTIDPSTGPCITNRSGNPTALGSLNGGTLTIQMSSPIDAWVN